MKKENFKIICVTNRRLCGGAFRRQIEKIAAARPDALILREKDLPAAEYFVLAEQVQAICRVYQVPCVWHTYYNEATEFVHLPFPLLLEYNLQAEQRRQFQGIGVSCHSLLEAAGAIWQGCTYLIAGHIFTTACKEGLPGRGIDFLRQICNLAADRQAGLPVYAIGGINARNIGQIKAAGAQGACLMSSFMTCAEPAAMLADLRAAVTEK